MRIWCLLHIKYFFFSYFSNMVAEHNLPLLLFWISVMARGGQSSNRVVVGSSSFIPSDDSNSPFFLQNGDHPGFILVTHPLTLSNYNTWSRAMLMALTVKSFVDGSILRPSPDDLLFSSWIRCNSMVTSWLLNSVAKEIVDSLLYLASAFEILLDLHDCFLQGNGPRVFQIKKHLTSL